MRKFWKEATRNALAGSCSLAPENSVLASAASLTVLFHYLTVVFTHSLHDKPAVSSKITIALPEPPSCTIRYF
jgi:hypothetical protein